MWGTPKPLCIIYYILRIKYYDLHITSCELPLTAYASPSLLRKYLNKIIRVAKQKTVPVVSPITKAARVRKVCSGSNSPDKVQTQLIMNQIWYLQFGGFTAQARSVNFAYFSQEYRVDNLNFLWPRGGRIDLFFACDGNSSTLTTRPDSAVYVNIMRVLCVVTTGISCRDAPPKPSKYEKFTVSLYHCITGMIIV